MTDLSILIPARNEMFLARTIADILEHAETDIEVIATLDGAWASPAIQQDPRVTVLYYPESIGMRAATNRAAMVATAPWFLKCDAHCSFDQGFDRKMLEIMQPGWTGVPVMRNLHAFDWVCPNGHRRYQGPSGPCKDCGEPTTMDVVWIAKTNPQSKSYCFDAEPHFQYFGEFSRRPEGKGPISETMSLQGSCFMIHRDKYFGLNICDEGFGSWGSQGIEVACKTWLSGGRVIVNHDTWYAHMFRTQGSDFSFPYPISGRQVDNAKKTARQLFFENKWQGQVRPLSWLVKKFWPVPGWTEEALNSLTQCESESDIATIEYAEPASPMRKGVVYYTDNRLDPDIQAACWNQLVSVANQSGIQVVNVSIQPMNTGNNVVLPLERGYLTMSKQILVGLEVLDADIVYFCEHDILYHPSHFNFVPRDRNRVYYNTNVWKVRYPDGHAIHYDCQQLSGLCARRDILLDHYRKRVANTEAALVKYGGDNEDFRRFIRAQGFEPGTHHRDQRVDDLTSESWQSEFPNIDIRHDKNLTPSRWSQDQFRNKKYCQGWIEADEIPGWGSASELMRAIQIPED